MNPLDVIRAWKDEAFRESLSEAERAALPEHPAGPVELFPWELQHVAGGQGSPTALEIAAKPKPRTRGCGTRTLIPAMCPNRPTYNCTLVCPITGPF